MLKLRFGAPPENAIVVGDSKWKPLSNYNASGAGAMRMLAIGATSALVLALLWFVLIPGALVFKVPSLISTLLVVVVLVLVHEALHLMAFPGAGIGNAIFGFWPAKGAAYVQYTLPIYRNRFILAAITPLAAISGALLVAATLGMRVPASLQWAAVLNAFMSGADLLVVYSLFQQASPSALVVESAQRLYVREA